MHKNRYGRVMPVFVISAGAALALGAAACGLTVVPAIAHHSFAVFFDSNDPVELTGTVTAFRFTNPHGTIAFDVAGNGGAVVHWRAETNAPVVLQRRGWTRTSIRPGQRITIRGWRARDGSNYMRLTEVRDAQGQLIGNSAFGQSDG